MNWDDIRIFLVLSKATTLKQAGKELGMDQASVGRRLRALEQKVGTKLFEKRSNGFFLTAAGDRIYASALTMEEAAHSIGRQIYGEDERPEGTIKVAMPGALANHLIIPLLKNFHEKFPAINVQLLTGPEVLNLSKREAEVAFRLVRPTQKNLIVKRLGDIHLGLYAHAELIKKGHVSKLPFVALYDHALSGTERILREKLDGEIEPIMLTAAWSSVYYALSSKLGIGILPDFLASQNKQLKKVQATLSGTSTLWAVIHPDLKKSTKVRAFLDFMIPELTAKLRSPDHE